MQGYLHDSRIVTLKFDNASCTAGSVELSITVKNSFGSIVKSLRIVMEMHIREGELLLKVTGWESIGM